MFRGRPRTCRATATSPQRVGVHLPGDVQGDPVQRDRTTAVTDHNTAGWCDRMAEAADDTTLVVLPGLELSTAEGHLLVIWEQGA